MRVLVAGGAGFIGSALVRNLIAHGHEVAILDNLSGGSHANLDGVAAELFECDAAECGAADAVVTRWRPTHLVSCVAETFVPAAYEFPERFFRANVTANLNLLQACRLTGIGRFLYLSTAEVYGDQPVALTEDAPLGAANSYAVSKLAADRLMESFAREHGVGTVIARIFNCYGPRETHAYIVAELIHQFARGDTAVIGDLRPIRDFTYVEDTAEALRRLLFATVPAGSAVNVGSGEAIDIGALALRIGRLMGHASPRVETRADRLRRNEIGVIRCDNRKLRALTGWSPGVALDAGLTRTIDWYRGNGSIWPWRTHEQEAGDGSDVRRVMRA